MSKYSKNPWQSIKIGEHEYIIKDDIDLKIAEVGYENDAKLMAAAPELLCLLREIVVNENSFGYGIEARELIKRLEEGDENKNENKS